MDPGLVIRAQRGDLEAFANLAAPLYARLHRLAASIMGDAAQAEDATQQAMLDVWRHLPQLRDPARFEAWCYRALTNACRSEGRRHTRWLRNTVAGAQPDRPAPDALDAVADRDLLEQGFSRLSAEHATIICLRYYADLTHEQMAEVLDIPVSTVRSRLHRAMQALRAALDSDARSRTQPEPTTEVAP